MQLGLSFRWMGASLRSPTRQCLESVLMLSLSEVVHLLISFMCTDSTFYMGIKTKHLYPVDMYSYDLSLKDNINSTINKIKLRYETP